MCYICEDPTQNYHDAYGQSIYIIKHEPPAPAEMKPLHEGQFCGHYQMNWTGQNAKSPIECLNMAKDAMGKLANGPMVELFAWSKDTEMCYVCLDDMNTWKDDYGMSIYKN